MRFIKTCLTVFACCLSQWAMAVEVPLVDITSEPENNLVHHLLLDVKPEGSIEKLIIRTDASSDEFAIAQIVSGEVVIARYSDRDIIYLGCNNSASTCSPEAGGIVKLRYLNNGIWNSYKSIDFHLSKVNGNWQLFNMNAEPVTSLRLVPVSVWGKLVGIDILVNKQIPLDVY